MGGVVKSVMAPVTSLLGLEAPNIPQLPTPAALETPPAVKPVTEMPVPGKDNAQAKTAMRRSVAEQRRRRGRQSTILTTDLTDSDTLG